MSDAVGRPVRIRPRARALSWRWLGACCGAAALAALGVDVAPAAARTAYVTDFDSALVTPIETSDDTPGDTIAVGAEPVAVAIAPDGETAYVVGEEDDELTPIDVASGDPGDPIAVGENPQAIAIAPDGKTSYVANFDAGTVTPIDLQTDPPTPGTAITVGTHPQAIAITPDGATAYVANQGSEDITPIDLRTDPPTPGSAFGIGKEPSAIAITPDGATAYVADSANNVVVPFDTATNAVGDTIAVGSEPSGIAIAPDGAIVYVTNSGSEDVIPIEVGKGALPEIGVGVEPQGIAITPDGARAYVADFGASAVTPIRTPSTVETPIDVGDHPYAVAIVPDQAPTAAFKATPAGIGQESSFDASESSDSDGTIATYHWDFGDGDEETTTSPDAEHIYAHGGTYSATLTVTDTEGCSTGLIFTGQTASCNGSPSAAVTHSVTVARETPTLTTLASAGVVLGGSVHDTATLAGGKSPTGQITFRLYGPDDSSCAGTPAFTSTPVVVEGAGKYASPEFAPAAAGTYRWVAEYSGDADNEAIVGECGAAGESVTVSSPNPPPPPPPTPPNPPPNPPSNQFEIGRPHLLKHKGTALLPITVPGPGTLALGGKGLAKARRAPPAAKRVKFKLKPKGRALRKLRRDGIAVVRARITFTPGGGTPKTKVKRIRLVLRRHS